MRWLQRRARCQPAPSEQSWKGSLGNTRLSVAGCLHRGTVASPVSRTTARSRVGVRVPVADAYAPPESAGPLVMSLQFRQTQLAQLVELTMSRQVLGWMSRQ